MDRMPLFLYFLYEEDNRRNYMRIERKFLRDNQNPFDIPDVFFINTYRLNKTLTIDLIENLRVHAAEPLRNTAIPFYLKVLTVLNFFGNGSYQTPVGNSFLTCLSQPIVSRAINEISLLISRHLMPEWIQFPTTLVKKHEIKEGFYNKWGFRGVIGAIDGTHVDILATPVTDDEHPPFVYINRKGKHSINVMLISDSNCRILAANARYPGSVHDAAIFQMSNIRQYLRNEYENGDKNSFLIGDSGYGLEPWLFTPFSNYDDGSKEALFNNMHKSARNVIERTNGVLKGRFRCLSRHRVLNYHPVVAAHIIYACCVLHNIALNAGIELDEEEIEYEDDNNDYNEDGENVNQNILGLGRLARAAYIALNI